MGVVEIKEKRFAGQDMIFEELDRLGLKYNILGGYPRDIFYGKQPRDMDLFVYRLDEYEHYKIDIFLDFVEKNQFLDVVFDNRTRGKSKEFSNKGTNYDDRRIETVIKLNNGMDVIFYHEHFRTYLDVVGAFDFNLNQFGMIPHLDGTYKPIYLGGDLQPILKKLKIVSPTRSTKMIMLAHKYGWNVSKVFMGEKNGEKK